MKRMDLENRWSEKARAASLAARRAKYGSGWAHPGWSDKARAAALEVRRAKAAARAAAMGGGYAGGSAAIRDHIGDMAEAAAGFDPNKTSLSDSAEFDARKAAYEEAFRDWWKGVEFTSENIAAFNAFVAAFAGVGAAGSGAYRQTTGRSASEGASRAWGRAGKAVTGKEPMYDESGLLSGFARVGGRPYARSDNAPARGVFGGDKRAGGLNFERKGKVYDPASGVAVGRVKYSEDVAPAAGKAFPKGGDPAVPGETLGAEYAAYLDAVTAEQDAALAARGLDPHGNAAPTGEAGLEFALSMYDRLDKVTPTTPEQSDAVMDALEGLRRYREMFENDQLERADEEGILGKVSEIVNGLEGGGAPGFTEADSAAEEALPYVAGEASGVREPAVDYSVGPRVSLPEPAAREAARALGVLQGVWGVDVETAVRVPPALMDDYEEGLAEGQKGYDYGITPPADRAGTLRRAQKFLDGYIGDPEEDYFPEHLNDRYNIEKFGDRAKWESRDSDRLVGEDTPDTRGQYSPAGLMRTAMEWLGSAMVSGDKGAANGALAYMADLLDTVAVDKRDSAALRREPSEDDDDDDTQVVARDADIEYDKDGAEVPGTERFFEDSYADPNAAMPFEFEERSPFGRWRNRLPEAQSFHGVATGRHVLNTGWTDEARAASLAVRRAKALARRNGDSSALPPSDDGSGSSDTGSGGDYGFNPNGDAGSSSTGGDGGGTKEKKPKKDEAHPKKGGGGGGGGGGRLPSTKAGWASRAKSAFRSLYGRDPESDSEIVIAERLAGVPKDMQSNGDPDPDDDAAAKPEGDPAKKDDGKAKGAGDEWDKKADAAFEAKHGRPPRTAGECAEAEELAGVPADKRKYATPELKKAEGEGKVAEKERVKTAARILEKKSPRTFAQLKEARRAAVKAKQEEERAARREARKRTLAEKFANPERTAAWQGMIDKSKHPSDPAGRTGRIDPKDKIVGSRGKPQAYVYYHGDGYLRDVDGNVIGLAPRPRKDGRIYLNGQWVDEKTGLPSPSVSKA